MLNTLGHSAGLSQLQSGYALLPLRQPSRRRATREYRPLRRGGMFAIPELKNFDSGDFDD